MLHEPRYLATITYEHGEIRRSAPDNETGIDRFLDGAIADYVAGYSSLCPVRATAHVRPTGGTLLLQAHGHYSATAVQRLVTYDCWGDGSPTGYEWLLRIHVDSPRCVCSECDPSTTRNGVIRTIAPLSPALELEFRMLEAAATTDFPTHI